MGPTLFTDESMKTFKKYICEAAEDDETVEDYLGNISLDNWNNQLLRFRVRNIPIGTTTKGRDNVLSSFTNAKAKCVGKVLEFKPDKRDTGWWSKVGGKWDDQWFHEDWLEPIDENLYEAIEDELDNESSRRYFKVKNIKQGTLIRVPGGPLIDFGGEKVDNIGKILSFEPIIEGWWNNKNWYYHESWLEEA